MTDNEIKQALPFLAKYCKEEYNDIRVDEVLLGASDLINRKNTEIERLEQIQSDNEKAFNKMTELYNKAFNRCKTAKAEAIKEFAERLKETELYEFIEEYFENAELCYEVRHDQFYEHIDNLVKEMVGDAE